MRKNNKNELDNIEKNEMYIAQLKKEMKELIQEKKRLLQENEKMKEDYDNLAIIRDFSKMKTKNYQFEKIKSFEDQVQFLKIELNHKIKLIESNKNLEFEVAKLKNEIALLNEENQEKEIKNAKEKNKELNNCFRIIYTISNIYNNNITNYNCSNYHHLLQQQYFEVLYEVYQYF